MINRQPFKKNFYRNIILSFIAFILLAPGLLHAGFEGDVFAISDKEYDQQNPFVIYLPDKDVYLVIWEDWRSFTTLADIYGQFLNSDGSLCGDEFVITSAIGNQTAPRAAYRDGDLTGDTGDDDVLVVWQDTRYTDSVSGFIYTSSIDVSSLDTITCSNPVVGSESPLSLDDDDDIQTPGTQSYASSRVLPKINYDIVGDRFFIVWVESRTTRKTISYVPFASNGQTISWTFGGTQFVGYTTLDGDTLAYESSPTIIVNENEGGSQPTKARLFERGRSSLAENSTYEFFEEISSVDIACDITTQECLILWEGVRYTAAISNTCDDDNDNDACDSGEVVTSTAESDSETGFVGIFGLFEKNIDLSVISLYISASDTSADAYNPSVDFDYVSKKFLVAWEDISAGSDTKIHGQLVHSGSGRYNNNFIISNQDFDGDGTDDLADSRQTNPFVSYDPVNQRYFVVWQDGRNSQLSLENLDIYGQKVDAEGSLRGENNAIAAQPYNQYSPVLAYNQANNYFLAVWKDATSTDVYTCGDLGSKPCGSDIYAQVFSLGQPALTLLHSDGSALVPPLLNEFEYPEESGSVSVGSSDYQSFRIRNTGDDTLTIDYINENVICNGATNPTLSPFAFESLPLELESQDDGETLDLVPAAEVVLTVLFEPEEVGIFNKCFIINSNGGNPRVNITGKSLENQDVEEEGEDDGGGDDGGSEEEEEEPVTTETLTITKSGTGRGTVTSIPSGINCGSDCDENYLNGTVVILKATPSDGSEFVEWSGSGGECDGSDDTNCVVIMHNDMTINAQFQ